MVVTPHMLIYSETQQLRELVEVNAGVRLAEHEFLKELAAPAHSLNVEQVSSSQLRGCCSVQLHSRSVDPSS